DVCSSDLTEALAAAMPLLQRIALTRETRAALAKDKNLLAAVREQIAALEPEVKVEEIRLERFRPRTLVTIIASALAAYFLLSQLSQVNLVEVVTQANWAWSVLALAASFASFVARSEERRAGNQGRPRAPGAESATSQ